MSKDLIRIGLSSCLFHEDKQRGVFNGRPLFYVEASLPHFLMKKGALVYAIPRLLSDTKRYHDLISGIDALVIHGGVDMSPESYGEKPLKSEWQGDKQRDEYEIALFHEAIKQKKPVLGICRGAQVINVACGGTLYQDVLTQIPHALTHRNAEVYEKNTHDITFEKHSCMSKIYEGFACGQVNSVHHQAVKNLGKNLQIEAYSTRDKVIEAFKLIQHKHSDPFCLGLQWHPEFQDPHDTSLLDPLPILDHFMSVIRLQRGTHA